MPLNRLRKNRQKLAQEKDEMTSDQIKHMVQRFLCWRLPDDFHPDCGINFIKTVPVEPGLDLPTHTFEPVGTNLLTAVQAEAMVRHMLEGLPASVSEETRTALLRAPTTEQAMKQFDSAIKALKEWVGK
jgi:hypothetical protein